MKEMLKTTASVLGRHKLPSNALSEVHDTMRAVKAPLDASLGLTESNFYRAEISLGRSEAEVRKDYPQTYAVIAHVLHKAIQEGAPIDLGSISLVNNSVVVKGQEGKLSRVVSKQLKGQENVIDHCMKELKITKPEQFLPKLGDIVRSGRKLWVSTNLLDFLTASEHASFTSCHSMSGCHFNGNLAYARDAFTLITFVTDEKATAAQHELYKLGRSWLFVVDNVIIQPKSYGAYYDFERDVARNYIETGLAASLGVPNKWNVSRNQQLRHVTFETPKDRHTGSGALYLDNYSLDMSHLDKTLAIPEVNFAAAMCLECGITTDYPTKGVCSEHDGKVKLACAICGERHLADGMHTVAGEGSVCRECYRKAFAQCYHCGQAHRKENLMEFDGQRTCKPCKDKLYVKCTCCGELSKKDRLNDMKGVGKICAKCQDKFLLCSICGMYHPKDTVHYHKYVGRICDTCTPKATFTCSGCGELHPASDKKLIDNEPHCPACVARRNGEELVLKERPKYADLPEGWDDYMEEVG